MPDRLMGPLSELRRYDTDTDKDRSMNKFLLSSAAALIFMATAAPAQLSSGTEARGAANREDSTGSVSGGAHSDNDSVLRGINSNARVFGDGSNTKIDTSAVSSTFGGKGKAVHDTGGPVASTARATVGAPVRIVARKASAPSRRALHQTKHRGHKGWNRHQRCHSKWQNHRRVRICR
jgi:hypothetical protein